MVDWNTLPHHVHDEVRCYLMNMINLSQQQLDHFAVMRELDLIKARCQLLEFEEADHSGVKNRLEWNVALNEAKKLLGLPTELEEQG